MANPPPFRYELHWARGPIADQIASWRPFLLVSEVARAGGWVPHTVARRCRQKEIPCARKPGGAGYLIPKAWLPVSANEYPEATLGELVRASLTRVETAANLPPGAAANLPPGTRTSLSPGVLVATPALLTEAEAVKMLRVGPKAVRELLARKIITGKFLWNSWRIVTSSIIEAMEEDRLAPQETRKPSRYYGKRRPDTGHLDEQGLLLSAKEVAWLSDFVPGGLLRLLGGRAGAV